MIDVMFHPTQPNSMTVEKPKERKRSDGISEWTGFAPYHGMSAYAMKIRTSVLNRFWKDHISDKHSLRGDTSPYVWRAFAAGPKSTLSFAMTVMDKVEGWNEEKSVVSNLAACMWIYTKSRVYVMGAGVSPPQDLHFFLGKNRGKCTLGN